MSDTESISLDAYRFDSRAAEREFLRAQIGITLAEYDPATAGELPPPPPHANGVIHNGLGRPATGFDACADCADYHDKFAQHITLMQRAGESLKIAKEAAKRGTPSIVREHPRAGIEGDDLTVQHLFIDAETMDAYASEHPKAEWLPVTRSQWQLEPSMFDAVVFEAEQIAAAEARRLESEARIDADARRIYEREKARERAKALAEAELPPHELKVLSLDELLEMPPMQWHVDSIVPKSAVVMVAGPGGVGKSALLVELAVRIATGTDFLGEFETKRGRVLYVAGEGVSGYGQRFQAVAIERGVTIPTGSIELVYDGFKLSDERSVKALTAYVTAGGFDIVILDTLSALTSMQEENSNSEAARYMNAARSLVAGRDGASVIVVHHVDKANGSARGGSAYRDNADAVWMLRGDSDAFNMSSRAEDKGKLKDGEAKRIRGLSLQPRHGSVVVGRATMPDVEIVDHGDYLAPIRAAVKNRAGEELTTAELLELITAVNGASRKTAERYITSLRDEGALLVVKRGVYLVALPQN